MNEWMFDVTWHSKWRGVIVILSCRLMASPVLQSFCCANSSFALYGHSSEDVSLAANDTAFLSYNVICVLSSTAGICGCLSQLVKRTPRCFGCIPTSDRVLLLLVQNNIIGCLATADLLAVVGTLNAGSWGHVKMRIYRFAEGKMRMLLQGSHWSHHRQHRP